MYRRPILYAAALATMVFAAGSACGGDDDDAKASNDGRSAAQVLADTREAFADSDGYRVRMNGKAFPLPDFGPIDGVEFELRSDGSAGEAEVDRSNDGAYKLKLADGEVFFKRKSCDRYQRIPGGGGNVFKPLLFGSNGELDGATNARIGTGAADVIVVEATLPTLGDMRITVDPKTSRTKEMRHAADASGVEYVWVFADYGESPKAEGPEGTVEDKAPGGDPC